jgi:hypothetical protein
VIAFLVVNMDFCDVLFISVGLSVSIFIVFGAVLVVGLSATEGMVSSLFVFLCLVCFLVQ